MTKWTRSGSPPRLERTTFRTSRLLDFLSPKELIAQTGHRQAAWPLVALKELVGTAVRREPRLSLHSNSGVFLVRFRDFPPFNSRVHRIVLPFCIEHYLA